MIIKKSFVILILFLYAGLISSQTEENDRFHLKKIREFTATNSDSLIYYSNKLKNSKNLCNFYRAVNIEAKALYQKSLLKLAKEKTLFVLENIKNRDESCFKKNKITALNRLFWIYKNQNQFQEAFDVLLKREQIVKSLIIKDNYYRTNLFSTEYNLAIIKSILGLHKEARQKLKKMITKHSSIYKDLKKDDYYLKLNLSSTLNTIGESYLKSSKHKTSSDLDSASVYFKRAFDVVKKFNPPHKNSETLYQLREAEVLIYKKKFKDALNLIQDYNVNSMLYKTTQSINSLKAICFYQLKNNDSTIYYSKQFLKNYTKKPKIKKRAISIYDILANQYYKNKQIDSAYKYSELTLVEIKALNKSKNEVNKSHYLYDFRNAEVLNKLILNKNNSNKKVFIFYFFVLLIIASFIIFFYYRKNKRTIIKFDNARQQLNDIPVIHKKEYNIDKKLENKFLKGINELKKSTDFLDPGFSIKVLSKKLNTNTSYLSYIINKEFNQSFKQYITELRIEYLIKKLTRESKYKNYTIKSLGEEIGYTNASAFTRAFKKYKGITPSEFIKYLNQS
jgi:AraC-like DNA-binding protein